MIFEKKGYVRLPLTKSTHSAAPFVIMMTLYLNGPQARMKYISLINIIQHVMFKSHPL